MKKIFLLVLIAVVVSGCDQLRSFGDPFVTVAGPVAGHNLTASSVEIIVNSQSFAFFGKEDRVINVRLDIPKKNTYGTPTGPGGWSAEEEVINVTIFVRDHTRATESNRENCRLGGKYPINVYYDGKVTCTYPK